MNWNRIVVSGIRLAIVGVGVAYLAAMAGLPFGAQLGLGLAAIWIAPT